MSDKNKPQNMQTFFTSMLDSAFADTSDGKLGAQLLLDNQPPKKKKVIKDTTSVDIEKKLGGVTGLYGKISKFLDVNQLAVEAEEYMTSGGDLAKEWSPDTWASDNLNFRGLDSPYRNEAINMARERVEQPGFKTYFTDRSKEGAYSIADDYFYNLALTDVYQGAYNEAKKARPLDIGDEIERSIGLEVHRWDSYKPRLDKWVSKEDMETLTGLAREKASGWASSYRKDLKTNIKGTVDQINKGEVSKKTGILIDSLNDMLNKTESLQTLYNTKEEIHYVQGASGIQNPDVDKILKRIETRTRANLESAGKQASKVYDPELIGHKALINATKTIK